MHLSFLALCNVCLLSLPALNSCDSSSQAQMVSLATLQKIVAESSSPIKTQRGVLTFLSTSFKIEIIPGCFSLEVRGESDLP